MAFIADNVTYTAPGVVPGQVSGASARKRPSRKIDPARASVVP